MGVKTPGKIRYVLGLDLESIHVNLTEDGIDFNKDRVMEIGAVLWDCEENQPAVIFSHLINESDRLEIDEELRELTGISENLLKKWGRPAKEIPDLLKELSNLMDQSDAIMAHNGDQYDRPMLQALYERHQVPFPENLWLDTAKHIEYPNTVKYLSMAMLEHSHGFINPFPHRAVTDVLSMLKVASQYSFHRMAKLASSPRVQLIAALDPPNWKNASEVEAFNKVKNRVAKSRFRWHPDVKKWIKEIPKILIDEDKIKYDFDYYIKEL